SSDLWIFFFQAEDGIRDATVTGVQTCALPHGATLTVTQKPAPSGLAGDTLGSVLCSIAVSKGVTSVPGLTLTMALGKTPGASAVLFQYVSPTLSELVP